jgi:hypothetical protein
VQGLLKHCRGLPKAAKLNRRPGRVDVFRDRPFWAGSVCHHNAPTDVGRSAGTDHK